MIKKGQILVAAYAQFYGCGATKLHMDAIIKAAEDEDTRSEYVKVYLSKLREENEDYIVVDTEQGKLRPANDLEILKWEAGVRNCKGELA